jgi:glycosyltransferase involved in cell wall biosynthesis
MNVVQVNSTDVRGGAGVAGYRLHQALLGAGADSRILVGSKTADDPRVDQIAQRRGPFGKVARRVAVWSGVNDAALPGTAAAVLRHPWVRSADILQFHNLHGGYFNYRAVAAVTRFRPAVWTLHDMWAFTGHCIYSFDCERWRTGCGGCPDLASYPAMRRDRTALEHRLKRRAYERSRVAIVTLCDWMTRLVKDSILSRFPVRQIPNGLDTDVYRPADRSACRESLGIPADRFVLMFAAQNLDDPRKGIGLLVEALGKLSEDVRRRTTLLTIGAGGSAIAERVGLPTVDLGYLTADRLKVAAFSAADLFVFPTRADNLPIVVQESMACGTPVVSCAVGGVPDMIRHGETGWLAPPDSADGIREGVERLFAGPGPRAEMGLAARAAAVAEYGLATQAARYLGLYRAVARGEFA